MGAGASWSVTRAPVSPDGLPAIAIGGQGAALVRRFDAKACIMGLHAVFQRRFLAIHEVFAPTGLGALNHETWRVKDASAGAIADKTCSKTHEKP
jgi:hypothetical protein